MKPLQIIFLLFFTSNLIAQRFNGNREQKNSTDSTKKVVTPYSSEIPEAKNRLLSSDTSEIPEGVIYVRKPHIIPYITVDYKLYLAKVRMAEVMRPMGENIPAERDLVPVYDSAYYEAKIERNYPTKTEQYSKYFSQNLKYQYQASDTPRIDTMVVGMEILKNGKVKFITPDTENCGRMESKLVDELAELSYGISNWGKGGGYKTKRKFLSPSKSIPENYYCELFIVVSSFPTTQGEKNTGTSYAEFDYPLNSPSVDAEQRNSMTKNFVEPQH